MPAAAVVTTDPCTAHQEYGEAVLYPGKDYWYYVQKDVQLCKVNKVVSELQAKYPKSSFDIFGVVAEM